MQQVNLKLEPLLFSPAGNKMVLKKLGLVPRTKDSKSPFTSKAFFATLLVNV